MGQDRGDETIDYNQGQPRWSPQPQTKSLNKDDWFDVKGTNFPAECAIQAVQFFNDQAKTQTVGTWNRETGPSSGLTGKFSLAAQSTTDVRITDVEDTDADDPYWFSVVIEGPNSQEWALDPEIINKKKR
jgi:hypothetical protein